MSEERSIYDTAMKLNKARIPMVDVEAGTPYPFKVQKALDVQVAGSHYKDMKIQVVEYCMANQIPYMEGNVIKYVSRWRAKGGIEDLKKARHYLDLLIEQETADR